MGRSIVTKGSSTKEAINTALNLLDAMKDQVDIEIIETELMLASLIFPTKSKGF